MGAVEPAVLRSAGESLASLSRGDRRLGVLLHRKGWQSHGQQAGDHREIAGRVEQEGRGQAGARDEQARHGRTHDARTVEDRRVQRDETDL